MRKHTFHHKRITKKIMMTAICVSMAFSMHSGMGFVCATQTSTTEAGTTGTSDVGTTTTTTSETTNIDPNGTLGKNSDIGIELVKSITGKIGQAVDVSFDLISNNPEKIKLKSVYPIIDTSFPFETSGDAYKIIGSELNPEKQLRLNAVFSMTTRSDLEVGYHSVRFIGEYTKIAADGTEADYYVIKTINIYFSENDSDTKEDSSKDKDDDKSSSSSSSSSKDTTSYDDDDSDSYSGGGGYSGGGSDEDATAPKLIITGFETNPKKVMAGDTFKLTIHVQNTSKTVSVNNGKFMVGNEAGNFVPTAGSNAVFVEKIGAGETGDIEIELKTSADLPQKNYILVVKGDYETGGGTSFTYSDNFYLPIYQEVKMSVSDVSMTPSSIGIGSQGSLMFTINNQGNAGVYNVTVAAKDDAVEAQECYVGNIAASSSAYATLNVVGLQDNMDKGTIHVVISYEDSEGGQGTLEQDVACLVGVDAEMDDFPDYELLDEEESEGIPVWVIVIIVVVVIGAIAAVTVVLLLKRKKKMAELLAEEDDDEDGEGVFEDEDF